MKKVIDNINAIYHKIRNRSRNRIVKSLIAFMLLIAVLTPVMPLSAILISAADTPAFDAVFKDGIIVIDKPGSYMIGSEDPDEVDIISVTVTGNIEADLYFYNVKIDNTPSAVYGRLEGNLNYYRASNTDPEIPVGGSSDIKSLYELAKNHIGMVNVAETNTKGSYYIPTCPVLVTGGAVANIQFNGENILKAGTNGVRVEAERETFFGIPVGDWKYTLAGGTRSDCGYAGIQVDRGSTLVLSGAVGSTCEAYGAHQFEDPDRPLDNNDDGGGLYDTPSSSYAQNKGGGAGIGGGASYNLSDFENSAQGFPGTIIINSGNIIAQGGHQAAGIGGAVNSAATSITINGGKVTAKGGRWAAGIGDGDTLTDKKVHPLMYTTSGSGFDEFNINILGGTIEAYGGVAAAGIGTSDQISSDQTSSYAQNAYSKLYIHISGGDIVVRSGYPSGSKANNAANNTAAIGAGQQTKMFGNSITIEAGCKLDAASFSKYAISNTGMDGDDSVPVVNLDSENHLFLCRFDEFASEIERTFNLWPVRKVFYDSVETTLYKTVMLHNGNEVDVKNYIIVNRVINGSLVPGLAEVKMDEENNASITSENAFYWKESEDGQRYYNSSGDDYITANMLRLAEDMSGDPLYTYRVPNYFKAIAVTLPSPGDPDFNGSYVLVVPTNGVDNPNLPGYITVGVTSEEQGVISGEVRYPEPNNIYLHEVSKSLTNICVYEGESTSGKDYIMHDISDPLLYSYDVYLPAGTTKATVKVEFEAGGNVVVKFVNISDTPVESDGSVTVDVSDAAPVTVRIQKQDGSASAITYAITIFVRKAYDMELEIPAREYNGVPLAVPYDDIVIYDDAGEEIELSEEYFKDGSLNVSYYDSYNNLLPSAPKDAGTYFVDVLIEPENAAWSAEIKSVRVVIEQRTVTVAGINNWYRYETVENIEAAVSKGEYLTVNKPWELIVEGLISGDDIDVVCKNAYFGDFYIGYSETKIVLDCELTGADLKNYRLYKDDNGEIRVPGQLYYDMTGAIFRKTDTGEWEKFYPTSSDTPLDFSDPEVSGDYRHQYGSAAHTEYVYGRTVNGGENTAMYAVDINYGSMRFIYTRKVWDVNTLQYTEDELSRWIGMDEQNNRVTVTNYSNKEIGFKLTASIDKEHVQWQGTKTGISSSMYMYDVYGQKQQLLNEQLLYVSAADASERVPGERSCYLELSGIPKFGKENDYRAVGIISVVITKGSSA